MATTIRNEKLFCLNCGAESALKFPLPVDEMIEKMGAFDTIHKDCRKEWVQPIVDQSLPVIEKAKWWLVNGEKGLSSDTMWNCLMHHKRFAINHPHDPDDFSRCYKLLETIPEWKDKLYRLKNLSKVWSALVDNWDKLTEMYEENVRTEWKKSEEIGMFKFMQDLIKNALI